MLVFSVAWEGKTGPLIGDKSQRVEGKTPPLRKGEREADAKRALSKCTHRGKKVRKWYYTSRVEKA